MCSKLKAVKQLEIQNLPHDAHGEQT
jgi:hypothetical protein